MSRTVVFDELCGEHDEFRSNYTFDESGRPIELKSLKRKDGKRKTVPASKECSLSEILGVKDVCQLAKKTQKPFLVSRNSKTHRRRRQSVGGRR